MKRGFNGFFKGFNGLFKGKKLSLFSILLMSTTIILLSWESFSALIPPYPQMLLPSEFFSSLTNEEAEILLEAGDLHGIPNFEKEEHSQTNSIFGFIENGSTENDEDVIPNLFNEEVEEKILEQEEHTIDSITDSPQHGSLANEDDAAEEEAENIAEAEEIEGVPNLSTANEKDGKRTLEEEEDGISFAIDSLQNGSLISEQEANNWNKKNDPQYEVDCNYGKGKWVMDNHRPLYSGFGCKRWLSGSWSCRLTQRTDFAYENLRWQPKDCDLQEFQPSKFLTRMQDKTLAFVGDSLGRQQFQSLMCMISGGDEETQDVEDVGTKYGLVTPEGSTHPHGYAYRFISTNTTILYYWSSTLCDTQPIDATNPDTEVAMHLDQPPEFLQKYLHKIHVLVLNTGHHWNRGKLKANRWVMHVNGVPCTDKDLAMIWRAKNFTVHSVVSWVNSQLPKHPNLKVFFRSISPRHFVGGDWDTGGSCNNTTPMSVGKEISDEDSSDLSAASAVKGTAIKLLDITALSQLRDEAHLSRFRITANPGGVQDCLHWCLPGVPDTWNEILSAQI